VVGAARNLAETPSFLPDRGIGPNAARCDYSFVTGTTRETALLSRQHWIPRAHALGRSLLLAPVVVTLTSCKQGVLDPQGPIGAAERLILLDATAIMLAVVIPVIVSTLVIAWWFRAGNRHARYRPDWEYSGRIEMIVWSIPMLVILFLGGIAWESSHTLDPPKPLASSVAPLEIQVVSLDWQWLFIYPAQGLASVNRIVAPVGTPIHFRLTSATVMNSFFVPQLGSQIYTMPGMTTQLHLQADRQGTYQGISAQFSGEGFSDMNFEFIAVTEDKFDRWVAEAKGQGGELDEAAFVELARPAQATGPSTFAEVSHGLFEHVASGHISADRHPQSSH